MYALSQGDRLESLADSLIERLNAPRQNPLAAPWVMVPHREMGHWLARRLASSKGICANVHFVQPSGAIWQLLSAANPDIAVNNAFAPDYLTPRIFGLLSRLPKRSDFAPVRQYLEGQNSAAKLAFASRMAGIFDQYLVFRPEWLMTWEQSEEGGWQGWIWRELTTEKPWHWARALHWLERERSPDVSSLEIPALHIFAQPTLSPGFFMAIRRFSEQLPTHVYHWTPTQAYWPDVPSPRARNSVGQEAEPYVSQLLASLGQPLKDTADQLFEWGPNEQDFFASSHPATLLGAIQQDLLSFDLEQKHPAITADGSLNIKRCTTRQREVEVCRDSLQAMFDGDATLQPSDVMLICPDLDAYLPAIRAEFGPPGIGQHWSWRVLGGNAMRVFDAGSALLEALALLSSVPLDRRCLGLLQFPAVQRRFRLNPSQAEDVTRWVTASGLFVNSGEGKFSWESAFDRLVGVLTLDPKSGESSVVNRVHAAEASAIGCLFDLLTTLQRFADSFVKPRSLSQWSKALGQLTRALLDPHFSDAQTLAEITAPLMDVIPKQGVEMDLGALTALLTQLRAGGLAGGGGPGGMTVAPPNAVRLLPARVIYVLGVSDGEFPGPALISELNLMDAAAPRRGDRARRLEDRLLLLEWISSARQTLVLSGRSRNPVSAEPEALSSLLEELLAWCHSRYKLAPQALAVIPPLHGFSPDYGTTQVGYATHFNVASPQDVNCFVNQPLTPVAAEQLSLENLCRFWSSPPRWFIEQVLGIWLDLPSGVLPLLPPVIVDPLMQYQLLESFSDASAGQLVSSLATQVALPDGLLGTALADAMVQEVVSLQQRVQSARGDQSASTVDVQINVGTIALNGMIHEVHGERRVAVTSGKLNAGRILDLWIRHLTLCCDRPEVTSVLVARDQSLAFGPVSQPAALLEPLVEHYLAGQQVPLPFYPETSRHLAIGKSLGNKFENDFGGGLSVHVALAFRGTNPLAGSFENLATEIWVPSVESEINADF